METPSDDVDVTLTETEHDALRHVLDRTLRDALVGYEGPLLYAEHHESHAASAFFPSPFEEAAILTMDGVGEWATASIGVGRGADLEIIKELFPVRKLQEIQMLVEKLSVELDIGELFGNILGALEEKTVGHLHE